MEKLLPPIPAKRYFTIGEVGELCDVKPHVLRYWEQEFTQLRPVKRRGNRRYYQHHEVLMIRRISDLLYSQGFTISGARNQLQELVQSQRADRKNGQPIPDELEMPVNEEEHYSELNQTPPVGVNLLPKISFHGREMSDSEWGSLRRELFEIRELLAL
jgi:DNA-binding transcriptional MerR regulator